MKKKIKKNHRGETLPEYWTIIIDAFGGKLGFACTDFATVYTERLAGNSTVVNLAGPSQEDWQDRNDKILASLGI